MDWGTLKILGEWQRKGPWLFWFQYLYYLAEGGLVFLIVAFGQKWGEGLLGKKTVFPFGGLVLCCTWGMIHIFSQGSLYAGAGVMAFSLCYGGIYLLLGRDGLKSYGMMALAFLAGYWFVRRFTRLREIDVHACGLPPEIATSRMAPSSIYGDLTRLLGGGRASKENR